MTQTIEEFAELNDYDVEKAHRVILEMNDTTKNPGLKQWTDSLLEEFEN